MVAKHKSQKGQAAIEMAFSLVFVIWLIYYTLNGFYSLHTAHVAQKYAAMSLWQRVNNRAKFVIDDVQKQVHNREFMAVRFTDSEGAIPRRKIIRGPSIILNVIGVCREPACVN